MEALAVNGVAAAEMEIDENDLSGEQEVTHIMKNQPPGMIMPIMAGMDTELEDFSLEDKATMQGDVNTARLTLFNGQPYTSAGMIAVALTHDKSTLAIRAEVLTREKDSLTEQTVALTQTNTALKLQVIALQNRKRVAAPAAAAAAAAAAAPAAAALQPLEVSLDVLIENNRASKAVSSGTKIARSLVPGQAPGGRSAPGLVRTWASQPHTKGEVFICSRGECHAGPLHTITAAGS